MTARPAGPLPVDADRIFADITALAEITEPSEPWTRRSFSPLFLKGRDWLARRFVEAGLAPRIDAGGNLIGRVAGSEPGLGTILVGSHSDTVPSGGRFDGIAGMACGLEIARQVAERQVTLRHDLEIVDFLAEEPSEYGVSCIGSRAMSGRLTPAQLALADTRGETLARGLERVGGDPERLGEAHRSDIKAAFELHIEQGVVLEEGKLDIGLVTGLVGISRLEVAYEGAAGHAGATPMHRRHDALVAAARLIDRVRTLADELAGRGQGYIVGTVGMVEAKPNASNVIPGAARIVIDARSDHEEMKQEFRVRLDADSLAIARRAAVTRVRFEALSDAKPAVCDAGLLRLLGESAAKLGLSTTRIASGAGHDTAFMTLIAPAAMIFIPCKAGLSHCPEEWAERGQVAAGTATILEAVLAFDRA
jgi:N-carbamoyl-L-amino-acid hydrolase